MFCFVFWFVERGNYVHFCNVVKMCNFHWKSHKKTKKRGRETEMDRERKRERALYVLCLFLFGLVGVGGGGCLLFVWALVEGER